MPGESQYARLIRQQHVPTETVPLSQEEELKSLLEKFEQQKAESRQPDGAARVDPIAKLRQQTITELIPVFVELVEKYGPTGISMQMDASIFLQGGREISFDFAIEEYRMQLLGTVTAEAIAFQETRYSPDVHGELVSGPMLRVRGLTKEVFRSFVCGRLSVLLRTAVRRHRPTRSSTTE